ncbi:hypothetical protein Sjap_016458 [Stephania japonica]|uniref:Uncharacterized protein n=1 Tax=Stephania japonica TaxID=461633 RepID=A0AAP0IMN9_9MAGN
MTIIANDDVAIDVETANRNLAKSIESRIQSHPLSKSCIYRVPEKLRSKAEAELRRDLLLLENQIPFIVLEKLLNLTSEKYDIHKIIKPFFNGILPASVQDDRAAAPNYGKHLLDLLRSYLILSSNPLECYDEELTKTLQFYDWEPTKCATDISEAGVKFKTSTRYGNYGLFDIKFDNGALEIPPFRFGESVTVLFRNLIALEQCQGHQHLVTSYVFLLHGLLKSPDDVKLLRPSMIVGRLAIDDQTVVNEVKNLCKGVVLNEFYYKSLCHGVNAYCRTDCWRKCKATWERDYLKPLRRDYFNTPWAFVSFAAAVILLLLTTIQTLYSLLSYYLRL